MATLSEKILASYADQMASPLQGLRVIDCSSGTASLQASGILADYGADVAWIEPPEGDVTRRIHPAAASVFNRGKRSIVLDVDDDADRDTILDLASRADVFIESWTPGRASERGLGYDTLHEHNVGLVYASITAFGQVGAHVELPAYEPLVHALVGTMAQQAGHRDGPIFQGLPFASTGAAQLAVIGILAALYRRMADGIGRHVETSLLDGALAFHSMLWGESDASVAATENLMATPGGAARMRLITRSFVCSDGEYVGIHTGAVGAFGRLMQVLELDDRIPPSDDGIDMGVPLTPEQADTLEAEIHGIFASRPRAHWIAKSDGRRRVRCGTLGAAVGVRRTSGAVQRDGRRSRRRRARRRRAGRPRDPVRWCTAHAPECGGDTRPAHP